MGEENRESIVDTSKPNAGRMYDYFLGGNHNFEIDRMAGERVKQLLPFIEKAMRLQRWSLQILAQELTENRGFDIIIDYASGLPTQDHIHEVVPDSTIVIYSDYDPITVEYAREILQGVGNVYYFLADARKPEELLNRPEVEKILGDRRDVAFMYWGVNAFLTQQELRHAAQVLHDWSGPSSCWVFNAQAADSNPNNPQTMKLMKLYEQMGSKLHSHSLDVCREVLQPWRPDENGFVSLFDLHGFGREEMSQGDLDTFGAGGAGYGAYLVKG